MTKYERVLSLSLNDMANFLSELQWDSPEPTVQEMYEWLSEPYVEGEEPLFFCCEE